MQIDKIKRVALYILAITQWVFSFLYAISLAMQSSLPSLGLVFLSFIVLIYMISSGFLLWKLAKNLWAIDELEKRRESLRISLKSDSIRLANDAQAEAQRILSEAHTEAGNIITKSEEELKLLQKEIDNIAGELSIEDAKMFYYLDIPSVEIKNKLLLLRAKQENLIKSGQAIIFSTDDRGAGVQAQARQLLRCFSAECTNIFFGLTPKNLDATMGKVKRSFDTLNRLYSHNQVQLDADFLALKLDELSLIYSCRLKEEEEKEQRRAIREQMVEEEKARRELEQARQKLEKEEAQFSNEIRKLMGYMQKAKDDIERQLYIEKINELEEQLKKIRHDKDDIANREQNTRAGFVYVISNIGSFGEDIYKIGMTRRLEPLDRIAELSGASVPFKFDVHALIFSDDAPALEAVLHQTFAKNQVNRVNSRKEFFHVDLEDIKRIVREHHNATVKFVDIPDAPEYRESIRMAEEA